MGVGVCAPTLHGTATTHTGHVSGHLRLLHPNSLQVPGSRMRFGGTENGGNRWPHLVAFLPLPSSEPETLVQDAKDWLRPHYPARKQPLKGDGHACGEYP